MITPKPFTPRQSLNKAYLKEKILRSEINNFNENLLKLIDSINHEEREENAKKSNPATNTSALESEIDKLVYQLCGLTEEEIKIVEGN